MKSALFAVCCLVMNSIQAQPYSVEAVKTDVTALIAGLQTYNPALYTYNPDFDQQVATELAAVEAPLSLLDYYALMTRIGALSNEGHFRLSTEAVFQGFLNNEYAYLPLEVMILEDQIFVSRYFSEDAVFEPYDEILSINGRSASDILEQLYRHIPSDGQIQTHQRLKAESGFNWRYYVFVEQVDSFEIVCRREGVQEPLTIQLAALTREQQVENNRNRYANDRPPEATESIDDFYSLNMESDHAYLQLKSFNYGLINQYGLKAARFYRQRFAEIEEAGVEHLIIDLRNNSGGRIEFTREILPFVLKEQGAEFLKRTISWEGQTKTYSIPRRRKDAFTGQIYVLVNGATFSSASELARYLKEYAGAIVIGEETGSRYEGFAAGSYQTINLPESGIEVDIPRYHILFAPATQQTTANRGVLPQVVVQPNLDDLKTGRDVILEAAIQLVQEE